MKKYPPEDLEAMAQSVNQRVANAPNIFSLPGKDGSDPVLRDWPILLPATMPGIIGDFVDLATQNSEADPAAVFSTFLCHFSAEVGPNPFQYIGDTKHNLRFQIAAVGASSKSRKGTSAGPVKRIFKPLCEDDRPAVISPGPLSSGEGLIFAVRDKIEKFQPGKNGDPGEMVVADPGVDDKRLFVLDEELGAALSAMKRDGNTLSMITRRLWDDGTVAPLIKNNFTKTTNAHVCVLTHITLYELQSKFQNLECFTGFANRILWACVRRRGLVADPQPMPELKLAGIRSEIRRIVEWSHTATEIRLDNNATEYWQTIYPKLSRDRHGIVGAVCDRAEAQVRRLAMFYAIIDQSNEIQVDHLQRAEMLWRFFESSAAYIFDFKNNEDGLDQKAERVLSIIGDAGPGGLSLTGIHAGLSRNFTKKSLDEILSKLISIGRVESETIKTTGRPKQLFKAKS